MEIANDRVWGTGITLGNPECLNRDRWISQGILGELLEEVRAQQHHHTQPSASVPATTSTTANPVEPIASKMLSIANYPQYRPPLQPPPLPDATLYMPSMPNVTWPPGLVPNCNTYQYIYPQPRYLGIQVQPIPPPVTTDMTQKIQASEIAAQEQPQTEAPPNYCTSRLC